MNPDITRSIAEECVRREYSAIPPRAEALLRQCLLDTTGTAIAGADEDFVIALRDELSIQGGAPEATVFGSNTRLPVLSAATINGTSAHALDYDDVNFHMAAHPSVAILPAVLALGERLDAGWGEVATSVFAGYESACRIGRLVEPSHYRMGFHGTATIGTFAAALAAARLLRLDVQQTVTALGIAASQAAGVRVNFGTACKPLHAGKAAHNGLFAALLAARGFSSYPQALTGAAGFAETHSTTVSVDAALASPPQDFFLYDNLFKYHAACYLTHAAADATAELRDQHDLSPSDVAAVHLKVSPDLDTVCTIAEPQDGLQLKFSVAGVTALTLLRVDTSSLASYTVEAAQNPALRALLPRFHISFDKHQAKTRADVELHLKDGRKLLASSDSGIPLSDINEQQGRLETKFRGLVAPVLGEGAAESMVKHLQQMRADTPIRQWLELAVAPAQARTQS